MEVIPVLFHMRTVIRGYQVNFKVAWLLQSRGGEVTRARPRASIASRTIRRASRRSAHLTRIRWGQALHTLRESDAMALSGVIHAQVVADLSDHHIARVQTNSHLAPKSADRVGV